MPIGGRLMPCEGERGPPCAILWCPFTWLKNCGGNDGGWPAWCCCEWFIAWVGTGSGDAEGAG